MLAGYRTYLMGAATIIVAALNAYLEGGTWQAVVYAALGALTIYFRSQVNVEKK